MAEQTGRIMAEQRRSIVILDKDPVALSLYRRELTSEYSVITCETVEEVQNLLPKQKFDILIMEPVGLGEQGLDLFDKIQKNSLGACIPIVICTTRSISRSLLQRGAATYLVKPVTPMDLHVAIRRVLSQTLNPVSNPEPDEF